MSRMQPTDARAGNPQRGDGRCRGPDALELVMGLLPGSLLERTRRWSDARVTFDRVTDVSGRCPRCDALVTRRLGPGVLCGTCGRLWIVREMLDREIEHRPGSRVKAKVLHADRERTIALVFETGEDPMEGLLAFAKREGLTCRTLHGDRRVRRRDARLLRLGPEGLSPDPDPRAGRSAVAGRGRRARGSRRRRCTRTSWWASVTGRRTGGISSKPGCDRPWRSS